MFAVNVNKGTWLLLAFLDGSHAFPHFCYLVTILLYILILIRFLIKLKYLTHLYTKQSFFNYSLINNSIFQNESLNFLDY